MSSIDITPINYTEEVKIILAQVDVSEEDAIKALNETKGDTTEAICKLLDLPPKKERERTEWDERREICDSYAREMNSYVSKVANVKNVDGKIIKTIPKPNQLK